MNEYTEVDVYERAERNFERNNPTRRWRHSIKPGARGVQRGGSDTIASLEERQAYLRQARDELQAEVASDAVSAS